MRFGTAIMFVGSYAALAIFAALTVWSINWPALMQYAAWLAGG